MICLDLPSDVGRFAVGVNFFVYFLIPFYVLFFILYDGSFFGKSQSRGAHIERLFSKHKKRK